MDAARVAPRRRRGIPGLVLAVAVTAAIVLTAAPVPAQAGGPVRVRMWDNWYAPKVATVAQGRPVEFLNFGQVAHDAQDGTGLDLFGTDVLGPPPDVATVGPLPGAGRYGFYCTFHPEMTGRFAVPVKASRTRVSRGGQVTVRWAAGKAPAGLVFDVQRRRPGSDRFVAWRTGVTAPAAKWWPSARGPWTVRARVRAASGGGASRWSAPRLVRVV